MMFRTRICVQYAFDMDTTPISHVHASYYGNHFSFLINYSPTLCQMCENNCSPQSLIIREKRCTLVRGVQRVTYNPILN